MNDYEDGALSPTAAGDCLRLLLRSRQCGLISEEVYLVRLRVLMSITSPTDAVNQLVRSRLREGGESASALFGENDGQLEFPMAREGPPSKEGSCIHGARSLGDHVRVRSSRRWFVPPVMEFSIRNPVRGVKGLSRWEFHLCDPDPEPSVPHGHWDGADHPKLDPYTGAVFDQNGKRDSRLSLSRKAVLAIWKDATFRANCARSIRWFSKEFPWLAIHDAADVWPQRAEELASVKD